MSPTNIRETVIGQLEPWKPEQNLILLIHCHASLVNWVSPPFLPMKMNNQHQEMTGSRIYGGCHKLDQKTNVSCVSQLLTCLALLVMVCCYPFQNFCGFMESVL